jgi:hypothetical protein
VNVFGDIKKVKTWSNQPRRQGKSYFPRLHMTRVIFVMVDNFKFCILGTHETLHFRCKYILTTNWFYIMYIMHFFLVSYKYEQLLLKAHFQNP